MLRLMMEVNSMAVQVNELIPKLRSNPSLFRSDIPRCQSEPGSSKRWSNE